MYLALFHDEFYQSAKIFAIILCQIISLNKYNRENVSPILLKSGHDSIFECFTISFTNQLNMDCHSLSNNSFNNKKSGKRFTAVSQIY